MTALEPAPITGLAELGDLADAARGYAAANRADRTKRAYASDWAHFTAWTNSHGLAALPAEPATVALYVTDMASTFKAATINRRLAAISVRHKQAGMASPASNAGVLEVMKGIRRTIKTAQTEAAPAVIGEIRRMIAHLPGDIAGTRDRAVLLVGFAGALRRSELVAIDVEDLTARDEGIVITIHMSKTDQEGQGRRIAIPYGRDTETCPVAALRSWMALADIDHGALFRPVDRHGNIGPDRLGAKAVTAIVKRSVERAGLEPTPYSGHSLRAGFITTAAANGAPERAIANQSGHKSMEVLRKYVRHATVFADNAATTLGL
jgi:integrase